MSHSEGCMMLEVQVKNFDASAITFCPECFSFIYSVLECVHTLIPVAFTLENGAIQIRQYCKKCHYISPNSEAHSGYDMDTLPQKNMERYRSFIDEIRAGESLKVNEFREMLSLHKNEFNAKEYLEYLQSPHWQEKRAEALDRDSWKCQICGSEAEQVHHLNYTNKGNEYLFELVSFCKKCHQEYHGI